MDFHDFNPSPEEIDARIRAGCTRFVFNMRQVKFIDSSGLGYLIRLHKRLQDLGGELILSEPSAFFQATLETLGLEQHVRIFPSDEAAQAYLQRIDGEDDDSASL